ncbi:hypothetical protein D210916BOD24_09000 [Alteromonas sp. D210916BOD_24]|uniref:hypothetical protein n=1 Tax=Alteromonas sp. D210916BOD_24 TaxID=3157618 RepID=UPI00399D50FF
MLSRAGLSFTELLVACAIATLVMSFSTRQTAMLHHSLITLQQEAALSDEMRTLRQVISQQLRNADYVMRERFSIPANGSPVVSSVRVSHYPSEDENSCITFAYDKNNNGRIAVEENEWLGFRLRSAAIEYRVSGKHCEDVGWHDLTDPRTTHVHTFAVDLVNRTVWGRQYRITLHASAKKHDNVISQSQFVVGVHNAR